MYAGLVQITWEGSKTVIVMSLISSLKYFHLPCVCFITSYPESVTEWEICHFQSLAASKMGTQQRAIMCLLYTRMCKELHLKHFDSGFC